MKILLTGANGQLAKEFISFLEKKDKYDLLALTKQELDVSNLKAVSNAISFYKPNVVINCSAYNYVDEAEKNPEFAFKVNAEGVKNLAIVSKKYKAFLVHYSTDYVFDGTKANYYTESDKPNPISKYGESKLLGEKMLMEIMDNFLLFRVSWVFGNGKQNFLYKMNELAKNNKTIKIVSDQVSIPTYCEFIVKYSFQALKEGLKGLFHLTSSDYATKYEWVRYYFNLLKKQISTKKNKTSINFLEDLLILPVTSSFFNSPAKRPCFSALSNKNLMKVLNIEIPDWRIGVERFVRKLSL